MTTNAGIQLATTLAPVTTQFTGEPTGGLGVTLASLEKPLQGMATSSAKAFENYVLSNGRASIEAGVQELTKAGVMTEQLASTFRNIDPTDKQAVSGAMDAMAKMKQDYSADTRATDFHKGQTAEQQARLQEELDKLGTDATPEQVQEATQRANKGVSINNLANTELDEEALAKYRNRYVQPEGKMTAEGQRVTATKIREVFRLLRESGEASIPSLATAVRESENAINKHGKELWGITANSEKARAFSNILRTVGKKVDTYLESITGQDRSTVAASISSTFKDKMSDVFSAPELGLSDSAREDLNVMMGAIGTAMADYIKTQSGATVSDRERRFLMSNLGINSFHSYGTFKRNFNNLVRRIQTQIQQAESKAMIIGPDVLTQHRDQMYQGRSIASALPMFNGETYDALIASDIAQVEAEAVDEALPATAKVDKVDKKPIVTSTSALKKASKKFIGVPKGGF